MALGEMHIVNNYLYGYVTGFAWCFQKHIIEDRTTCFKDVMPVSFDQNCLHLTF